MLEFINRLCANNYWIFFSKSRPNRLFLLH